MKHPKYQAHVGKPVIPRDPITLSNDEQGVYNHLRNARYLGSMLPFSVLVSQDPRA